MSERLEDFIRIREEQLPRVHTSAPRASGGAQYLSVIDAQNSYIAPSTVLPRGAAGRR